MARDALALIVVFRLSVKIVVGSVTVDLWIVFDLRVYQIAI